MHRSPAFVNTRPARGCMQACKSTNEQRGLIGSLCIAASVARQPLCELNPAQCPHLSRATQAAEPKVVLGRVSLQCYLRPQCLRDQRRPSPACGDEAIITTILGSECQCLQW